MARRLEAGLELYRAWPESWPLLVGVLRKPRKVLPGALVAMLLVSGTAAIAVGPTSLLEHLGAWLLHVPLVIFQGSFLFWNFSLSVLPLRLLECVGVWDYGGGPLPAVARVYLVSMGVAAPLLTAWLTREREPRLQFCAVLTAAVLFAPLGWATYLPFALAPVAFLMSASREEAHESHVARST